jgi:hypothetical protein
MAQTAQFAPAKPVVQVQPPEEFEVPWPLQLALLEYWQRSPLYPLAQVQVPLAQVPWPEQVASPPQTAQKG